MDKLRSLIVQHGHWRELNVFVERIEAHIESDFSLSLENAKSLLETISKEICERHGVILDGSESFGRLLKLAFQALEHGKGDLGTQISGSLANIAQQMGNLRNEIGTASHGRTLAEIRERNSRVDEFTKEFLIDSTVLLACFLIRNFELDNPVRGFSEQESLQYVNCQDFNLEWDDIWGEFSMGSYSFGASEILFALDYSAYVTEYGAYKADKPEV